MTPLLLLAFAQTHPELPQAKRWKCNFIHTQVLCGHGIVFLLQRDIAEGTICLAAGSDASSLLSLWAHFIESLVAQIGSHYL